MGKPKGKRQLENPWRKSEDNIDADLKYAEGRGLDSSDSGQGWLAGCCEVDSGA
jgi:hypothetical protein